MKRMILLLLPLCLLLSGCAMLDGREISVTPHERQSQRIRPDAVTAENYLDLMKALAAMIASGTGEGVISIPDYDPIEVDSGMEVATRYAMENFPIGAYAVEDIRYEVGTSAGEPALAVTITYSHNRSQIQRIRSVENVAAAEEAVLDALESVDPSVILLVSNYVETDISKLVEEYAEIHPEVVMETPEITVDVYGTGAQRVMEIGFVYQNSREDLRLMREQVTPVFDAAELYVSGEGAARQKYSQLYGFLMERFYYTIETSITPSYSLLRHGVGDSRAFATVYAAMCRRAGLECMTITGTYEGEPRTWNLIRVGSRYFHLDLMRCRLLGRYREYTDDDMRGYVWDYSAYPKAIGYEPEDEEEPYPTILPDPTAPTDPSVPTQPSEPTEPSQPTEPDDTIPPWLWPWWPSEPTTPTEPTESTQPTAPTTPTTPNEPSTPTVPTEPETQPTTPSQATEPTDTTEPAETETTEPSGENTAATGPILV